VIAFDEVFRGTIDGASVHPRDVVKLALARNAAAVILAHNHPSGIAEPSQADEMITGACETRSRWSISACSITSWWATAHVSRSRSADCCEAALPNRWAGTS
jgi:hypothetical protein